MLALAWIIVGLIPGFLARELATQRRPVASKVRTNYSLRPSKQSSH